MAANTKIFIPRYISSVTYAPARVLPHIYFYNGQRECEPWYIEGYSGSATTSSATIVTQSVDTFPQLDYYSQQEVTGSSLSLLFNNEFTPYGTFPSQSLYSEYWETYVSLLYDPHTRLVMCSAIIPLADYFTLNLNDVIEWRGNYYYLRAINDYNTANGECNLQLLGPILDDTLNVEYIPPVDCNFSFTAVTAGQTTTTSTTSTTTSGPTSTTTTEGPNISRNGLTIWNRCNSLSGSVWKDVSGNNNNALISGSLPLTLSSSLGVEFVSSSSNPTYLTYPSSLVASPSSSFTLQFFGSPKWGVGDMTLFGKSSPSASVNSDGWFTAMNGNTDTLARMYYYDKFTEEVVTPPATPQATRSLYTFIFNEGDGYNGTMYLNNNLSASFTPGPFTGFNTASTVPFTFGYDANGGSPNFGSYVGTINDIVVYNRALSQSEINQNYLYLTSQSCVIPTTTTTSTSTTTQYVGPTTSTTTSTTTAGPTTSTSTSTTSTSTSTSTTTLAGNTTTTTTCGLPLYKWDVSVSVGYTYPYNSIWYIDTNGMLQSQVSHNTGGRGTIANFSYSIYSPYRPWRLDGFNFPSITQTLYGCSNITPSSSLRQYATINWENNFAAYAYSLVSSQGTSYFFDGPYVPTGSIPEPYQICLTAIPPAPSSLLGSPYVASGTKDVNSNGWSITSQPTCPTTTTSTSTSTTSTSTSTSTTTSTTTRPPTSTTTSTSTTSTTTLNLCNCTNWEIQLFGSTNYGCVFQFIECGTGTFVDTIVYRNDGLVTVCVPVGSVPYLGCPTGNTYRNTGNSCYGITCPTTSTTTSTSTSTTTAGPPAPTTTTTSTTSTSTTTQYIGPSTTTSTSTTSTSTSTSTTSTSTTIAPTSTSTTTLGCQTLTFPTDFNIVGPTQNIVQGSSADYTFNLYSTNPADYPFTMSMQFAGAFITSVEPYPSTVILWESPGVFRPGFDNTRTLKWDNPYVVNGQYGFIRIGVKNACTDTLSNPDYLYVTGSVNTTSTSTSTSTTSTSTTSTSTSTTLPPVYYYNAIRCYDGASQIVYGGGTYYGTGTVVISGLTTYCYTIQNEVIPQAYDDTVGSSVPSCGDAACFV